MTSRGWDQFLTDEDKEVFAVSGYGVRAGFGARPVLVVVDVNKNFCGDRPQPILESARVWRNSCGEYAWSGIGYIQQLLAVAREVQIPVIYSTASDLRPDRWDHGRWRDKNARGLEDVVHHADGNDIIDVVAPGPRDIVIRKSKPSVFHGSMLHSFLVDLQVDSLIVTGTTTSGCVRATVVDAFSYNYKVALAEEACFDRGQASHWLSLFDMDQKYADVVSTAEVVQFLVGLPAGLFGPRLPGMTDAKGASR